MNNCIPDMTKFWNKVRFSFWYDIVLIFIIFILGFFVIVITFLVDIILGLTLSFYDKLIGNKNDIS